MGRDPTNPFAPLETGIPEFGGRPKNDLGTVLVTGAAGYVGSQLCWHLHDLGVKVIGIDTQGSAAWPPSTQQVWGNVAHLDNGGNLREMHYDWVVHLAAFTSASESIKLPMWYWENNVIDMSDMMKVLVRRKVRGIVFMSSSAVYSPEIAVRYERGVTEEDPLRPLTPYGSTKLAGEELVRISGIPHVILRLFNVAGADSQLRTGLVRQNGSLVKTACRAALTGGTFTVNGNVHGMGDSTPERDLVHVEDVAHAIVLSLKRLQSGGDSLLTNLGTGESHSVTEVLREVNEQVNGTRFLGDQSWIRVGPARAGDVAFSRASTERLRRELGWQPTRTLTEMVRDSLAWERKLIEEGW